MTYQPLPVRPVPASVTRENKRKIGENMDWAIKVRPLREQQSALLHRMLAGEQGLEAEVEALSAEILALGSAPHPSYAGANV